MKPNNGDIALIFEKIANILEIQGENPFKIKAYRNAVDSLRSLDKPVADMAEAGELKDIPGFGDAIRSKTIDILATGTTPLYERIKNDVPDGIIDLLNLPGIGAKTLRLLWKELKIADINDLIQALDNGKIQTLPAMGEKSAQKIRDSIEKRERFSAGMRIDEALSAAETITHSLETCPEVIRCSCAGSVRRSVDIARNINIVVATFDITQTKSAITMFPWVTRIHDEGVISLPAALPFSIKGDFVRVILYTGFEALIAVVEDSSYVQALLYFTGSQAHLTHLASHITDVEKFQSALNENDAYQSIGFPYIIPELREDKGEIEAAISHTIPQLIELSDIRGDLHAHTTASDGSCSIQEMAEAAIRCGYEYMAITDHSQHLVIANGLTPDRLREQISQIKTLQDKLGIRIFSGSEVDIKADGSMDFDDALLAELDIVIASAHLHNRQDRQAQTQRLIKAIENPYVDLIAHPTGRLINRRDPYDIDLEAVYNAAVRTGTALEINAAPERLDLNGQHVRDACKAGVKIIINTDAHSPGEYGKMRYGVTAARRGWLTKMDVLNTLPLAEFEAWLRR